jgi:carbamoyltransferase
MIILGIHSGNHNSSVALLKDNKVLFHIENERLSNIKYDRYAFKAIEKVADYVDHIDHLVITGFDIGSGLNKTSLVDAYISQVSTLNKTFKTHGFKVHNYFQKHHETHAATAFYNSGFDTALCIVLDGTGTPYKIKNKKINPKDKNSWEIKSAYKASYPHKFELVEKYVAAVSHQVDAPYKIADNTFLVKTMSEANVFELASELLGFNMTDAGKVMGLAPYGKENSDYPKFYKNGFLNIDHITVKNDIYVYDIKVKDTFEDRANFAFMLQKDIQEDVARYILDMIEKTGEKNVCLSGGFFLNCVSNYNLLKQLPEGVKLYVEPISGDAGNAIGAAKECYYDLTQSKEKIPQNNIYYGPQPVYDLKLLDGQKLVENISPAQVAQLISEKNIVALYQGSSESGPRALGNRSILYDPRDPNGKDHVNSVKMRESFRPFAGTVLKEYAKDWFEFHSLEESKFMMFAVDVIKDKQEKIPAITHVDGTCRIQTLNKEDNPNYYELIEEFYKITNVPILFNTSLNLAGDAINETLEDALNTFYNSKIDYLYLPELKFLITKEI